MQACKYANLLGVNVKNTTFWAFLEMALLI